MHSSEKYRNPWTSYTGEFITSIGANRVSNADLDLLLGLSDYFVLYNSRRPHQALQYKTPDVVYASASGGGAVIIDKYGEQASAKKTNSPDATVNAALLDG